MNVEHKSMARTVVGNVISNNMNQTIVVLTERKEMHPLYGKYVRKFTKLYAHDSENECKVGDIVQIQMCRPLSKTKSWKLVKVVNQAAGKDEVVR